MKQIFKSEHGIKALEWLKSKGINHEFNWDKPTETDYQIWEAMRVARVLVDRNGQHCWVVNEYGPNPHGITKPAEINKMYLSSYSNNWSCEKRA